MTYPGVRFLRVVDSHGIQYRTSSLNNLARRLHGKTKKYGFVPQGKSYLVMRGGETVDRFRIIGDWKE